jgi:hypothetical protein
MSLENFSCNTDLLQWYEVSAYPMNKTNASNFDTPSRTKIIRGIIYCLYENGTVPEFDSRARGIRKAIYKALRLDPGKKAHVFVNLDTGEVIL